MVNWKFWKKEEKIDETRALGLPEERLGLDVSRPVEETYDKLGSNEQFRVPEQPSYEPARPGSIQQFSQNTDLQLISSKLDTIKAMLDVINQRLNNLEKNVEEKNKQKLW